MSNLIKCRNCRKLHLDNEQCWGLGELIGGALLGITLGVALGLNILGI